ncbi:hypothetical protein Lser_V15G14218 [Lactuca serriola]
MSVQDRNSTSQYTMSSSSPQTPVNGGENECDWVWNEIKAEARRDAESEPSLASHLYSTIISHSSLIRSLSSPTHLSYALSLSLQSLPQHLVLRPITPLRHHRRPTSHPSTRLCLHLLRYNSDILQKRKVVVLSLSQCHLHGWYRCPQSSLRPISTRMGLWNHSTSPILGDYTLHTMANGGNARNVIQFIDNDAEGKRSNNSIVVIKSKSDLKYQIKDEKKGKETIKSLSLNDLLLHETEGNPKEIKNDAKRTKRSMSEPSDSFSPEVQCKETNPLLPTEMVEHLKTGLGS